LKYNNIMTQEELHIKFAKFILNESMEPIDEIEWLIQNLKPEVLEELEESIKTLHHDTI